MNCKRSSGTLARILSPLLRAGVPALLSFCLTVHARDLRVGIDPDVPTIHHAIKLAGPGDTVHLEPGKIYRDYFCVGINFEGDTLRDIRALAEAGLMQAGCKINEGRDQYFHVTEAGQRAAVADVKPLEQTKSQRRYRAWLGLDLGISFREFLTHPAYADLRRSC